MTAVAPPPNFQSIPRAGWSAPNGASNGMSTVNADMFMPRKSVQRSNSNSSIASSASSSSTSSTGTIQANGVNHQANGDVGFAAKKRPARGLWPPGKADAVAALSNARSQPTTSASSGPSAASAISALHNPPSMLPSQQGAHNGVLQNGVTNGVPAGTAQLHLLPMNGTFERKTITVPFFPDVLRIGRQTNNRTVPSPTNGYFDSKVLSRQHAEIWADRQTGKIWIRDVKSSNGTFVNGQRLSQENKDSDPHELRESDMLELGIDIVSEDQKTVVHHKVAARVEHAGFIGAGNNLLDLNFGDLDPSANGGLLSQPLGPGPMRGRAGSQGSVSSNGSIRSGPSIPGSAVSGMNQRQANFWLSPITMDQVVKRINSELKLAKQQTKELQRTGQYVETLISSEPKKETKAPALRSLKSDLKARFSDPPAPPPQQPLPEKPDVARSFGEPGHQLVFRRTETAKPGSTNGSPVRQDSTGQVGSLVEALNTARKELDLQNIKLKDLEDLLTRERQARESAEERVLRLEQDRKEANNTKEASDDSSEGINGILTEPKHAPSATDPSQSSKLQERIDFLLAEMVELKQQMEAYRRRAEFAEESQRAAQSSLAEMIEKIRADEAARAAKTSSPTNRKSSGGSSPSLSRSPTLDGNVEPYVGELANGHIEEIAGSLLKRAGIQNGRPITPEQLTQLDMAVNQALATRSRSRGETAVQAAPYASIVGVVVLGLGLMAYLNGWQKGER